MSNPEAKAELITRRLRLRWMTEDDAALALAVWNDPDFVRHVGDRGIRTLAEARQAMRDGLLKLYADFGYGPYLIEALEGGPPMGLCGLFKREYLEAPDIGYGLLPGFRGKGYALEAASAVLAHARDDLRLPQLKAIVSVANERSVRLLESLGMRAEGTLQKPGEGDDVTVYGIEFSSSPKPPDPAGR
ncbi:MAG: GNAT family N-acetyltransferase [Lysobacterales bacterium]|jgi:RimJ/RimL family protein N-acetyltransferase